MTEKVLSHKVLRVTSGNREKESHSRTLCIWYPSTMKIEGEEKRQMHSLVDRFGCSPNNVEIVGFISPSPKTVPNRQLT